MSDPLISVAMCTYNGARYVREQLESIVRQTAAPDEVVICDDASTDRTAQIVETFLAHSAVRVRLIRNTGTLGCTGNFQRAIRLCRGDIIVLADQDDIWKPEKVARIAETFASNPGAGYAFSDADMVNEQGEHLGFSLWQTLGFEAPHFIACRQLEMLLKRNLVTGAAMAFRSSLGRILLPIPAAWSHDYWIALLGSIFGCGVPISERLFWYRRHFGQQLGCGHDTFAAKVRTSLAAEPDYYTKAARIAELRQRAEACAWRVNCPPEHLRLLQEKQLHLSRRALIRSARGGDRIARLVSEASTGRYQRFSFSWGSMIRDLTAAVSSR
jgi:glycosyltransferase involved in cell wall biosynthesis